MQIKHSGVLPVKHLPYNSGKSTRAFIPQTLSITITSSVGIVLQFRLTICVVEKTPVNRPPKPMPQTKHFAGLVSFPLTFDFLNKMP